MRVFLQPSQCSCDKCSAGCKASPCWPTPEQGARLREAQPDKTVVDATCVGPDGKRIHVIRPAANGEKAGSISSVDPFPGQCVFYVDGGCELHHTGLKPMEGRLWSHTLTRQQSVDLRLHFARLWHGAGNG